MTLLPNRSLESILKVFDKAVAQLEVYIKAKSEEAVDNAAKAAEHQQLATDAIEAGDKAKAKLERIKQLTSLD